MKIEISRSLAMTTTAILQSLILVLLWAVLAQASEFKIRASGEWVPEQEVTVKPPGGADINFNLDDSFGAYLEIAKYSPQKFLSFGFEGGFKNLTAGNPVSGVSEIDAQVFSVMGKGCGHLQNKSKFTPFGCGGVGMFLIEPDVTLTSGAVIDVNSVVASGFSLEGGAAYQFAALAVRGGVRWTKTFSDPTVSISGSPIGLDVDIDHFGVFAGVEF